jgi:hypothetical protein
MTPLGDPHSYDDKYSQYLKEASARLRSDNFNVDTNLKVDRFETSLFAYTLEFSQSGSKLVWVGGSGYQITCSVVRAEGATVDFVTSYSQAVLDHAHKISPDIRQYQIVIPVAVASRFSDELKTFAQAFAPVALHYPVGDVQHPVLLELESNMLIHVEQARFKGYRLNKVALKAVPKYFSLLDSPS